MRILMFVLLLGVLGKELSYLTPGIIFAREGPAQWAVFLVGMAGLVFLVARYAHGAAAVCFGAAGLLTMAVMWLKQGVSRKGVLTIARGREFFPWKDIGFAVVSREKYISVSWRGHDGTELLRQKYPLSAAEALALRLGENGISGM